MKIFADQCIHADVIKALREEGFKVETASEADMSKSSDEEIFNYVLETSQVLLTFDHDFGNILRFDIKGSQGVVIFYLDQRLSRETIESRVVKFFSDFEEDDLTGRLLTISATGQVRVWPK